jgi:endonuclease/exonuclease/phosphatase family metal-dependent hydrolase
MALFWRKGMAKASDPLPPSQPPFDEAAELSDRFPEASGILDQTGRFAAANGPRHRQAPGPRPEQRGRRRERQSGEPLLDQASRRLKHSSSAICRAAMLASLTILTWNIFMMPGWIHESPGNLERARAMVLELHASGADILVLEKAFDSGARDVLQKGLADRYPYAYGPVNSTGFLLKLNGGVLVLSSLPLDGYREIQFHDATDVEVFSRKGAMLLSGVKDGRRFQLVATHLQGDEKDIERSREVRKLQIDQIEADLVAKYADPGVPLFFAGDFCLPRWEGDEGAPESADYRLMLEMLAARNGPGRRITLDDSPGNDLASDKTGRIAELDYVLVRDNGHPVRGEWRRHVFRHRWSPAHQDLSYRYAVSATFDWQ